MRFSCAFRWVLAALVAVHIGLAAGTKKDTYPARYEGGTLLLKQQRIKATVGEDEVIITRGSRRFVVPVKNITLVTCATDVRRRFGGAVLAVIPLVHLDKAEEHYVGMAWTRDGGEAAAKVEVVFALGNGEYQQFVAALERATGRKAVNTGKVPTVVRYGS